MLDTVYNVIGGAFLISGSSLVLIAAIALLEIPGPALPAARGHEAPGVWTDLGHVRHGIDRS